MKKNCLLVLLFFFSCITAVQTVRLKETSYLSVKAQKGDGVLSLLRRYGLEKFSCNLQEFYKINNLKKDFNLRTDISYKVPILIYKYDGLSIRTSIIRKDLEQAMRIKELNINLYKKKIKPKDFVIDKILWVPYHELNCIDNQKVIDKKLLTDTDRKKVKKGKIVNFPIFGKTYGNVIQIDNKLQGKVFYIEGGHGGPDPGAMAEVAKNIISEDEYAYDISLRVSRLLLSHGATVYIILRDPDDGIRDGKFLEIDNDEVCYGGLKIPLNQKKRLQQRATAINNLYFKHKKQGVKDQRALLIHIDSRNKSRRQDVFFYYQDKNQKSKTYASNILKVFVDQYKKVRRGTDYQGSISTRNLFMMRETKAPTVFVEVGNIKNPVDQKRIIQKENRQLIAQWLYEGIIK